MLPCGYHGVFCAGQLQVLPGGKGNALRGRSQYYGGLQIFQAVPQEVVLRTSFMRLEVSACFRVNATCYSVSFFKYRYPNFKKLSPLGHLC